MNLKDTRSSRGKTRGRWPAWLAIACVAILIAFGGIAARAQVGSTIREIRVEGVQRIEPETVGSYLTMRAGEEFDGAKIDESLRALFAPGLFAGVSIRREGDVAVVRVVETPIINRLAFEGNSRI